MWNEVDQQRFYIVTFMNLSLFLCAVAAAVGKQQDRWKGEADLDACEMGHTWTWRLTKKTWVYASTSAVACQWARVRWGYTWDWRLNSQEMGLCPFENVFRTGHLPHKQ
ncbi:hypothetical protein CPB85DRAFT_1335684 [Mucidula mucida]|nr:hypothetical protein CPB85DRAFT_1335684 [Mucidula mucida]